MCTSKMRGPDFRSSTPMIREIWYRAGYQPVSPLFEDPTNMRTALIAAWSCTTETGGMTEVHEMLQGGRRRQWRRGATPKKSGYLNEGSIIENPRLSSPPTCRLLILHLKSRGAWGNSRGYPLCYTTDNTRRIKNIREVISHAFKMLFK